jgi:hypothetical protein
MKKTYFCEKVAGEKFNLLSSIVQLFTKNFVFGVKQTPNTSVIDLR